MKGYGTTADLVITNAKIVTIDKERPQAEAVAFLGEEIMAVGTDAAIEKFIEEGTTEVIDAGGRLVIPGFNDAHTHFNALDPDYIDLRYITDPALITERVKAQVAKVEPGVLIEGGRWEHEMFYNKQWPSKELLDPVAPDNPVVLTRADGHSYLVNSYVLKLSGITKDTPDPAGGEIQRDPATGEPTGIVKETARLLIKTGVQEETLSPEEQVQKSMREWQAAFDMAKHLGVTSVQIVKSSTQPGGYIDPTMYDKFRAVGKLTLRVYFSGWLTADEEELAEYQTLKEKYPLGDNWIRFGMLKGFIDGTLGSGTALFFEPFADEPDKSGLPQMPYEELEKRVLAADKAGFQIAIHAIGDKGNHWILNAFEKAQEVNGKRDSRHRSEHAQIIRADDIPRFAELGVIPSMQPTHCITDKRFAEKRIGLKRCKGAYAWRSLLDVEAKIAFGTDYAVEPLDPMEGLYAAVTRKDRQGEPGEGWFCEQKLTMEEAIELYTLGSAYAEFMEDRKGMIKEGYLGDVVILNQDLMTIAPEEIMKTKVDYTILGGKVVYKREGAR
ncbi:MAG: hypothetical protein AMJ79_03355 [Phycisphaerae bacterium SM23_30]|nr:MAG: hypothetical protein AMJ79_03355 [Phycisphaerae bacterium SM23_30]